MISGLKRAYGGGYRAGICGASWRENPHRYLKGVAWGQGWHKGMTERLNAWLRRREVKEAKAQSVLKMQIAALTQVVYNRKCDKEEAAHLADLLVMLEKTQDAIAPLSVTHYTA